ncbi:MAG: cupin domain-containing protein [Gammaproteobacteria bacterium]
MTAATELLPAGQAAFVSHTLPPTDTIPNNPRCALIAYRAAAAPAGSDPASVFESLFASNGWGGGWRNGIFSFHHFHSTAHEVLGVYSGSARVQFGGEGGLTLDIETGDVVIVPAGVGHKQLSASKLGIVGAYPRGQSADLCRPDARALAQRTHQVASVRCPDRDPVCGANGPLRQLWPATG